MCSPLLTSAWPPLCHSPSAHALATHTKGHAHVEGSRVATANCVLTGPSYYSYSNYTHTQESAVHLQLHQWIKPWWLWLLMMIVSWSIRTGLWDRPTTPLRGCTVGIGTLSRKACLRPSSYYVIHEPVCSGLSQDVCLGSLPVLDETRISRVMLERVIFNLLYPTRAYLVLPFKDNCYRWSL